MVKLNKIYTRTGDDGTTALGDGTRRRKDDPRVAAYGSVDETNSALGLARLSTAGSANSDLALIDRVLARAQNDLFDLGADLCMPAEKKAESRKKTYAPLRVLTAATDGRTADRCAADHSRKRQTGKSNQRKYSGWRLCCKSWKVVTQGQGART